MAAQYAFSITGYKGHEDEILQMRNRNRRQKCSREYLDWRYLGEPAIRPPMIFWMRSQEEDVLAMASLIFRPFLVNGEKQHFGVLGDVSVNEEHRGEGFSTKLFQFMNNEIEKQNLSTAFVMPNKAAGRALSSAKWITVGNLVPRVCVTEPFQKCKAVFKVSPLAKIASWGLRALTHNTISRHLKNGITLQSVSGFDDEFQLFWDSFPKKGLIIHDRSVGSLNWRFQKQPQSNFSIGKFFDGDRMVGYVVSTVSEDTGMCLVADFVVNNPQLVKPCMALFVRQAMQDKKIITVRIVLIEDSEYAQQLSKVSFFPRDPVTVFQVYRLTEAMNDHTWFITPGDKDA